MSLFLCLGVPHIHKQTDYPKSDKTAGSAAFLSARFLFFPLRVIRKAAFFFSQSNNRRFCCVHKKKKNPDMQRDWGTNTPAIWFLTERRGKEMRVYVFL